MRGSERYSLIFAVYSTSCFRLVAAYWRACAAGCVPAAASVMAHEILATSRERRSMSLAPWSGSDYTRSRNSVSVLSWNLEPDAGSWKLETGNWKLKTHLHAFGGA